MSLALLVARPDHWSSCDKFLFSGEQPVRALEHIRSCEIRMPIIRPILKAEFSSSSVLMERPALVHAPRKNKGRRTRKVIRITKGHWIGSLGRYDVNVPAKMRPIQAKADDLQPIDRAGKAFYRQSFCSASRRALNPPDHANPSGLVGPVRRAGNA